MSTVAKSHPITIEQYLGFQCPSGYRDELINGEIGVSPDPKPLHHDIATNIFTLLERKISDRYGRDFKVGQRVNMRLTHRYSMPSPDVWVLPMSTWRAARDTDTYPVRTPLIAIEVVSKANSKMRVQQKVELYLSEGSAEVWVVRPRKQTLTVHRSGGQILDLGSEAQHKLSMPLEDIQVSIADIFRLD